MNLDDYQDILKIVMSKEFLGKNGNTKDFNILLKTLMKNNYLDEFAEIEYEDECEKSEYKKYKKDSNNPYPYDYQDDYTTVSYEKTVDVELIEKIPARYALVKCLDNTGLEEQFTIGVSYRQDKEKNDDEYISVESDVYEFVMVSEERFEYIEDIPTTE